MVAEPRSNALIVRAANPARLALVRSLVDGWTSPPRRDGGAGNIHVVYLKNADATKLAATLARGHVGQRWQWRQRVPSARGGHRRALPQRANSAGHAGCGIGQPPPAARSRPTPATNSLIITAPEPQYRQLRAVIDKLDAAPRPGVCGEPDRRGQCRQGGRVRHPVAGPARQERRRQHGPVLGTNFGIGGNNIINLATQGAARARWRRGRRKRLASATVPTASMCWAFWRAFWKNGDGNILSTPNLLTLDNEEAKIVIGQNVPFVTGQYTNNNSQQRLGQSVPDHRAQGRGPDAAGQAPDQRERHGQAADLPGGVQRAGVVGQLGHRPDHQQALDRVQRAGG
jgi:general secretion pathway protein D